MEIKITETKVIRATPQLLAEAFWELDNNEQAEFFNHLAIKSDGRLNDQMDVVTNNTESLSYRALYAMKDIGEAAQIRIEQEFIK